MEYSFNESMAYDAIASHWKQFMKKLNMDKVIIGISGGIDSTCVAALACKIFGQDSVYGLSMPCDEQHDIVDVVHVFNHLSIKKLNFNIGDAFHSVIDSIENNGIEATKQTKINLPPRLRMAALYAFSQSIPGALVVNTCNLSESLMGYDTLWGDDCGSYAPIKNLTKSEVRKLARFVGVPENLVMKTPIDGLQGKSDEERFGFTYDVLDRYIRTNDILFSVDKKNIADRYVKNKFKLEMVKIHGPEFDFPDYVQGKNV